MDLMKYHGLILVSLSFIAEADNFGFKVSPSVFKYSYFDMAAVLSSTDNRGINIKMSGEVEPNFALQGQVQHFRHTEYGKTNLRLGVTYHQLLNNTELPHFDWLLHMAFELQSFKKKHASESEALAYHDVGVRMGTGWRYQVHPFIDMYTDVAVSTTTGSTVHVQVGANYNIKKFFQLHSLYEFSDSDKLIIGLRYYF